MTVRNIFASRPMTTFTTTLSRTNSSFIIVRRNKLEVDLLSSPDDKIVQRELAYLRELRYGKRASPADDEAIPIIFDAPRPERDLP